MPTTSTRRVGVAALTAALIAIPSGVATAPAAEAAQPAARTLAPAQYPPIAGPLYLSHTRVRAGRTVYFLTTGFASRERVHVHLIGPQRATILVSRHRATRGGHLIGSFRVPRRTPPGVYQVRHTGQSSARYSSARLRVLRYLPLAAMDSQRGAAPQNGTHAGMKAGNGDRAASINEAPVVNQASQPATSVATPAVLGGAAALTVLTGGTVVAWSRRRRTHNDNG